MTIGLALGLRRSGGWTCSCHVAGSSFGQDAGSARACASLTYGWDRFPNVPPSFAVWPDTDRDVDKARGAESERCGRKDGGPGRERSAGKEVECDRWEHFASLHLIPLTCLFNICYYCCYIIDVVLLCCQRRGGRERPML